MVDPIRFPMNSIRKNMWNTFQQKIPGFKPTQNLGRFGRFFEKKMVACSGMQFLKMLMLLSISNVETFSGELWRRGTCEGELWRRWGGNMW